jgi:RND family efflux transporter MFP subunit
MKSFKPVLKILLPLMVLVICFFVAKAILGSKAKVKRHAAPSVVSVVEVVRLVKGDYRIIIESQGTVRARTRSAIVPEVSGKVVDISPNLREGGFFEKGDVLLLLDRRNYETDVAVAVAELAKARQRLAEEEALSAQAVRNWRRLRPAEVPTALAVREPQLLSAMADAAAAEARLNRAELDLERTCIKAPYAGRVLEKSVDLGEYVTAGAVVAKVYGIDYAEIRLPLSDRELEFVELPDIYRGELPSDTSTRPMVDIVAKVGSREHVWSGEVVRSEGTIDEKSRQLFIVAEVKDPYAVLGRKTDIKLPPLKVGRFVEARIKGRLLKDVYVLPRRALRDGTELFMVKDERLVRRNVDVLWTDRKNIVISGGLEDGDLVVTTPSVYMKSGKVKVVFAKESKGALTKEPAQGVKPAVKKTKTAAPKARQKSIAKKKPVVRKTVESKKPAVRVKTVDWDIPELKHLERSSVRKGKKPVAQKPAVTPEPATTVEGWDIPELEHLRHGKKTIKKPASTKPVVGKEDPAHWDIPELNHLRDSNEADR